MARLTLERLIKKISPEREMPKPQVLRWLEITFFPFFLVSWIIIKNNDYIFKNIYFKNGWLQKKGLAVDKEINKSIFSLSVLTFGRIPGNLSTVWTLRQVNCVCYCRLIANWCLCIDKIYVKVDYHYKDWNRKRMRCLPNPECYFVV